MTFKDRELHVHLGVDGLFETLFEALYGQNLLNEQNTEISYVTAEVYRAELRTAVDAAAPPMFSFTEEEFSRNLLISRPRMVFPGAPLNCVGESLKHLYKLEHLQRIFSGRTVFFHLFLTDHISYFFKHQKYVAANPEIVFSATWMPLVEAVLSKVFDGNELHVWNAEELQQFLPMFLDGVLRVAPAEQDAIVKRALSDHANETKADDLQGFIEAFGLNQDFFDHVYEDELRKLKIL